MLLMTPAITTSVLSFIVQMFRTKWFRTKNRKSKDLLKKKRLYKSPKANVLQVSESFNGQVFKTFIYNSNLN